MKDEPLKLTRTEINARWKVYWNALLEANQIEATTASQQLSKMAACREALQELFKLVSIYPTDVKIFADPPEVKVVETIESYWPEEAFK